MMAGYPDHLRGAEIPLTARILQLADVFDALTTNRPYRKADRSEIALGIMDEEAKRGWWDRDLFDAFCKMIREGYSSDGNHGEALPIRSTPA
jgi:putative two-component system response regulator